jgi:hypothetical protein
MSQEVIHETFNLQLEKPKRAKANLFLYEFEDNGFFIVYNKSLELSAYGKTPEEAKKMFVEVVYHDFCENLTELSEGDIFKELKRLGWTRSPIFKKELSNTACVDKQGVLKDFNLAEGAIIKDQYVTV